MAAKRFHIIIEITNADNAILNDEEGLRKFLLSYPSVIGMHVLKGPLISAGIPENPGLSGVVLIDYSHISIHTFTDYNQALVDIFSCKPYDQDVAANEVLKYFHVSKENSKIQEVSWV